MEKLLTKIVAEPELHCRWLNTLSLMENTGAKKIKQCEHPIFVNETILKHAAEEARHAYYLKKQIQKINPSACPNYEQHYLLAPKSSYHYLNQLDVSSCRYLISNYSYTNEKLKYAAYLLVTYAIEVRADDLYPRYQEVLKSASSSVSVRNIIVEEEHHLQEMTSQLKEFSPYWEKMCEDIRQLESALFANWLEELEKDVMS